jgi:hypothetical protein
MHCAFTKRMSLRAHQIVVRILFAVHCIATVYMTGVIWMVQLVHYPLMALVGDSYIEYQRVHMDRMGFVVGLPMVVEALSALLLLRAPFSAPAWERWVGLGLVGCAWLVTALASVPAHSRLAQGFDAETHAFLVRSNWLRTVAWTARAGLVGLWVTRSLAAAPT